MFRPSKWYSDNGQAARDLPLPCPPRSLDKTSLRWTSTDWVTEIGVAQPPPGIPTLHADWPRAVSPAHSLRSSKLLIALGRNCLPAHSSRVYPQTQTPQTPPSLPQGTLRVRFWNGAVTGLEKFLHCTPYGGSVFMYVYAEHLILSRSDLSPRRNGFRV